MLARQSELVQKAIEEAEKLNEKYSFFITINEKAEGKFPVAVKDNICTKGIRTTAGSNILSDYVPVFDATVIEKIKKAGGVIIGKTAMDEFGFGSFCVNGIRIPKNPLDSERCCGGSSGGSAGYIAASKYSRFALGQSTGGSISNPAAFCGIVGLTPTYGLVSRYGLIDYANSMDKIGTFGKSMKDAAELLTIIAGHDPKDSTSIKTEKKDYAKFCKETKIKGMKIGVPKEYFENIDSKISKLVWDSVRKLEKLGCEYSEINLPLTKYSIPVYYIIAMCESSTNLAKFCGLRYGLSGEPEGKSFNEYFPEIRTKGFGEEAKRRILLGTYARMAGYREQYYLRALKLRSLIIEEFKNTFKRFDILAAPTMPMIAPKFSEIEKLTPLQNYMSDILTVPANLSGIPHISVPCGKVQGMPVGLHIIGNHFDEEKIIKAAHAFEVCK